MKSSNTIETYSFYLKLNGIASVYDLKTKSKSNDLNEFLVTFERSFPKDCSDWQDLYLGSISIVRIERPQDQKIINMKVLPIEHQIYIRHCCWGFLQNNHICIESNVIPFILLK